jgi:hypothetical protein
MFVIPCKFNKNNPIIFSCVEAIQKYHPGEKISVIDSNSDDTGYQKDLGNSVDFYDVKNNNYQLEAYHIAFKDNQKEDFFYCIHDSLIIQQNISFVEKSDLTTVRWWNSPPVNIGWDESGQDLSIWANEQMNEYLGYTMPSVYKGVFGSMLFASNKVFQALNKSGVFNIKAKDKYESCAVERIIGIVLSNLGYDVTNSLQGEGGELFSVYDETYVKKIHLERM